MLNIISGLELAVTHGIFFQPHESGIMVCLGIAVTVAANIFFHNIFFRALDIGFQLFHSLLEFVFLSANAMNKFYLPFMFDDVKLLPHLFKKTETQIGTACDLNVKIFYAIIYKDADFFAHLLHIFGYCLFPDESIFVCIRLDFGSINEDRFTGYFTELFQQNGHLRHRLL